MITVLSIIGYYMSQSWPRHCSNRPWPRDCKLGLGLEATPVASASASAGLVNIPASKNTTHNYYTSNYQSPMSTVRC